MNQIKIIFICIFIICSVAFLKGCSTPQEYLKVRKVYINKELKAKILSKDHAFIYFDLFNPEKTGKLISEVAYFDISDLIWHFVLYINNEKYLQGSFTYKNGEKIKVPIPLGTHFLTYNIVAGIGDHRLRNDNFKSLHVNVKKGDGHEYYVSYFDTKQTSCCMIGIRSENKHEILLRKK